MTQPRAEQPTIKYIDEYCASYRECFKDVRNYEHFKQLHVGMTSDLKRKTLPAIAHLNGLSNYQGLHNFLSAAGWDIAVVREQRLKLILELCAGREIILIVDESGDPKKGHKTDYVARQYREHPTLAMSRNTQENQIKSGENERDQSKRME